MPIVEGDYGEAQIEVLKMYSDGLDHITEKSRATTV